MNDHLLGMSREERRQAEEWERNRIVECGFCSKIFRYSNLCKHESVCEKKHYRLEQYENEQRRIKEQLIRCR